MVRIPSEYQEVEYLESTGTQWIKTDISSRFSITAESIIEIVSTSDTYTVGVLDGNFRLGLNGHYGSNTQTGYGGSYYYGANGYPIQLKTKYKYKTVAEPKNQQVFLNDELVKSYTISQNVSSLSGVKIGIFGRCKGDTADLLCKDRIYSLILSDDGEILGNFIPCYRKSDNEPGMYDTVTGTFYTNSGTGTFLVGNDVSWDTASLLERRRQILLNTPHIATASGSIATFNTDMSTNLTDLKIHFHPVQSGSGDPSPDNVRPITGWDGLTVRRTGKNLFDKSNTLDGFIGANGAPQGAGTSWQHQFIYVKGMTKITVSGSYVNTAARNVFFDANMNPLNAGASAPTKGNKTLTVPSDAVWYGCSTFMNSTSAGRDIDTLQVEKGSTATAYEPYTALEIPISFGRTIYGGYVDLAKGEVVEEYGYFNLNELCTNVQTFSSGNSMWYHGGLDDINVYSLVDENDCSDMYTVMVYSVFAQKTDNNVSIRRDVKRLYVRTDGTTDIAPTGHAALKLNTPNAYILTPQTIKALHGINNIWSDANGNVEVKFWKH